MNLYEFLTPADIDIAGRYDPTADRIGVRHTSDTRKGELTLRQINKLKRIRALNRLEALKREDLLAVMYAQPEGEEMGGPPGF